MQLGISPFLCPEIERDGCNLVHHGFSQSVFREVDGFHIGLAGITTFHSHIRKLSCGKDGQFIGILFSAVGAHDAAKLPFRKAERTD